MKKLIEVFCACPAHVLAARTAALAITIAVLFMMIRPPSDQRANRRWRFKQLNNSFGAALFPAWARDHRKKAGWRDHIGVRRSVAAQDTQR
jgi:hypothetical protein